MAFIDHAFEEKPLKKAPYSLIVILALAYYYGCRLSRNKEIKKQELYAKSWERKLTFCSGRYIFIKSGRKLALNFYRGGDQSIGYKYSNVLRLSRCLTEEEVEMAKHIIETDLEFQRYIDWVVDEETLLVV